MSLPGDLTTTTVTGTFLDPAGNPMRGTVTIQPNATLLDATGNVIIPQLQRSYQLFNGSFTSAPLVSTDNTDINPSGFAYLVTIALQEVPSYSFTVLLPHSPSPVDLSALSPAVANLPDLASYLSMTGGTLTGKLTLTGSTPLQIPAGAAAGDVLTSDASGNASWSSVSADGIATASALAAETSRAETAEAAKLPLAGGTLSGTLSLTGTPPMQIASGASSGDVLSSDGSGNVSWGPPAIGTAGTGLTKTGTTLSLTSPVLTSLGGTGSTSRNFSGLLTETAVQTSAYAANPGDFVCVDTTSAGVTVTLPNAPADLTVVAVKLVASTTPANAVTIVRNPSGTDVFNVTGGSTSATLTLLEQSSLFQYQHSTGIWLKQTGDVPLTRLDQRYTQFVNVLAYGADATGANDSTSAINAALTVVSASNKGTTVFFPAGSYKISGTLAANGSSGVTLLGCGGTSGGAAAGTKLIFSNTGSGALITAASSLGFRLRGIQVVYSSSSFTGNMLDLRNVSAGDTALFRVEDCLFAASSTASATACIALDKANSGIITGCNFEGAAYGILGRASGSSYSNANTVTGCQFVDLITAGIRNPGQGWLISGNTFENLSGGGAGGVLCDSSAGTYGTEIAGNWLGDATVNSGSPISINGGGFSVHGNYIGYTTGMTAVAIGNNSVGFKINANRFDNGGGTGTTAISLGTGCSSYDCTGNGAPAGMPSPLIDSVSAGTLTLNGVPFSVDTTATDIQPLGTQAAGATGLAADAGHVHPAAAYGTNLITNPDFASGTTGWATAATGVSFLNAGGTLTQDTSDSADGSGTCGQVVTTSSTFYEGARFALTGLAASTTYVFSVYLKMTSGSQSLGIICWDDTNGIYGPFTNTAVPCPSSWGLYTTTITTGSTGSINAFAAVRGNSAAVSTFLISGAFLATYTAYPLLDTVAGDIQPLGSSALAGSAGKAADAGHVHPATGVLPLAGGTMSGPIAMGTGKITGLGNGSAAQDAAAFGQVPTRGQIYAYARNYAMP